MGAGITLGLLEAAVIVSVWFSLGAPELIPVKFTVCAELFSLTVRLAMGSNVGGTLTGLTVTVNDRTTVLLLVPPSLTVTEIVAEPKALATGARLNVPVAPGLV